MPKDRDQLTPDDPADTGRLNPRRSADRVAVDPNDPSTGPGPGSSGSDPKATNEVGSDEKQEYR